MAGSTTNLGLTKPTYSEDADIAVINTNMDTLDSKIGTVGSTSLQAQITSANEAITTQEMLSGDLNSLGEGQVYASGTTTNRPDSAPFIVKTWAYGTSRAQLAFKRDSQDIVYFRVCNGGTWYSWQQLALNSNLNKLLQPTTYTVASISELNTALSTVCAGLSEKGIIRIVIRIYGGSFEPYNSGQWECELWRLDTGYYAGIAYSYKEGRNIIQLKCNNGTWTHDEFALKSETQKFSFSTIVTDFNSALESGIYAGNSATNSPITGWVIVLTMRLTDNDNYIAQIALQFGNNYMYIRTRENGTWKSWKNVSAS